MAEIVANVLGKILHEEVRSTEERGDIIEFFVGELAIAHINRRAKGTVFLWNERRKTSLILEKLKVSKGDSVYTSVDIETFRSLSD